MPESQTSRLPYWILGATVVAAVFLGWRLFFFLTDDAFIAFRYVSNSMLGYGWVWNPPPFQPVEGYTSWLWIALLKGVWSLTGISPPVAANLLSLACGYATLGVAARLVAEMELPERLARHRFALVALVLLGTVTNRTFLAWLSSGLETALFNLCLLVWIYTALRRPLRQSGMRIFWLCASAVAGALTRPDGLLLVLGSVALIAVDLAEGSLPRGGPWRRLAWAFPLLGTPLHLLWRRFTYGEWLPNTYFAKHVEAWPESGLRYAASFALEYAVWIWLALALVWAVRRPRLGRRALLVAGALAGHFAYYTFNIGGDHFEYRVYSHLVLLLPISLVWFAGRLDLRLRVAVPLLGALVVASWPVPWVHYFETRDLSSRVQTLFMVRPIAERFPPGLRWYAEAFDELQRWLIRHSVCVRHQEHKIYAEFRRRTLPTREEGARIAWEGYPVGGEGNVGVLGWVLPHVAIIDVAGLNDWVVARSTARFGGSRLMAHDRRPPPGYLDCFRPNVSLRWSPVDGKNLAISSDVRELGDARAASPQRSPALRVEVERRAAALTAEDIVRCERRYRKLLSRRRAS